MNYFIPLEKKGSQFRIRVRSPGSFKRKSFRNLDVGSKGHLQLIRARLKSNFRYETQAIRVSTRDFSRRGRKLHPKTARGRREVASLKRKRGSVGVAARKYLA